jgi:hypothetical protein
MTPREFWKTKPQEEIGRVCDRAGTSLLNFQQLACYRGSVSPRLAEKLAAASDGQMSEMEILYQERYLPTEDQAA